MNQQHATPTAAVERKLRMLVVDDYPDAALMACELIRALGHACEYTTDGATALARAEKLPLDVVVLDIGMPELSGYDVARALREQKREPPLVIVALTGWGQPADLGRAADAGFDHHIIKPANVVKLRRMIELAHRSLAVL